MQSRKDRTWAGERERAAQVAAPESAESRGASMGGQVRLHPWNMLGGNAQFRDELGHTLAEDLSQAFFVGGGGHLRLALMAFV